LAGWLLGLGLIASSWQREASDAAAQEVATSFCFTVELSADDVFGRVSDPRRHPKWVGGLARVVPDGQPLTVGAAGREVWWIVPWPVNARYEITAWEPGRRWACRAVSKNLEFDRRIELLPATIGGPTESVLDGGGAMNHAGTKVDVRLRMIAKGKRGIRLKMVLGQLWAVLGLSDQDRLRHRLSTPGKAEKGSYARVCRDWICQALRWAIRPHSRRLGRATEEQD
jgi:hypothetical protein